MPINFSHTWKEYNGLLTANYEHLEQELYRRRVSSSISEYFVWVDCRYPKYGSTVVKNKFMSP